MPAAALLLVAALAVAAAGLFLAATSIALDPMGRATALVFALIAAAGLVFFGLPAALVARRGRGGQAVALALVPYVALAAAWFALHG